MVPALIGVLTVGACASDDMGPSQAELRAQWDAQNVYPKNYKDDLLAYMRSYLNDPTHIRNAAIATPQLKYEGPGQRYMVCVRYSARDDHGHYGGAKEGAAVYVSGRLDHFIDQKKKVDELCKDAAFAPFPALETLSR
jgi:hypothetical protein